MKNITKTVLTGLYSVGLGMPAAAQTWVESDGLVVIETERIGLPDGWARRNQASIAAGDPRRLNGFTGDGFIEWVGEQTFGLQIDEEDADGLITYNVQINTPGVYSLRWRNKQQAAGQARDAGNDTFLRFASGTTPSGREDFGRLTKVFIQEMDEWTFDTRAEPRRVNGEAIFVNNDFRRFLNEGVHQIQLSGRSPGHVIDRIVLHRDGINFNENVFVNTPQSRVIPNAGPEAPAPAPAPVVQSRPIDGVRYPGGSIAVVADGNSRDPDDIGGTAISIALLRAADMNQFLVHYSHSCDLVRDGRLITASQEQARYRMMNFSCNGTANRWGGFNLNFFNADLETEATVQDLAIQINASTSRAPLYIVEAGEPDIIYMALDRAQLFKSRNVRIITHSAANDNSGDFHDLSDIVADFPRVTVLRIPDQNTRLISEIDANGNSGYDWARDSDREEVRFLFNRLARAELEGQRGIGAFQEGQYDPSDCGMVAYWVTGADGAGSDGGRRTPTPRTLQALVLR